MNLYEGEYYSMHIPTMTVKRVRYSKEQSCILVHTRLEFLELLNAWNTMQPEIWKYWTVG